MFKKVNVLPKENLLISLPLGNDIISTLFDHHTSFPKRKVAVVVSKKVVKSAVKRNLIKRRVFAVLHNELSSSNYKGVLLVIVKPAFATLSRKQAAEEFRSIIAQVIKVRRIGILCLVGFGTHFSLTQSIMHWSFY